MVFDVFLTNASFRTDTHAMETKMIGEAIRQLRLAQNMTQQDLMDRAHLTRSQIHYIEKNKRTPRKQTLENISAAFGMSLFELLSYVFQ